MADSGQDVPALRERPTLPGYLWYYRDIFDEVAGSRHYAASGEPLPIPISEIHAYCEMFSIYGLDARAKLLKMVRALDRAFLDVIRKRREQETRTTGKTPQKPTLQ